MTVVMTVVTGNSSSNCGDDSSDRDAYSVTVV